MTADIAGVAPRAEVALATTGASGNTVQNKLRILDLSAGNRSIWFNRLHTETIFVDSRPEMRPTVVADTRCLPFNEIFDLIVFDPPHMTHGKGSDMAKAYSSMIAEDIKELIRKTSLEAYRLSHPHTFFVFKWNDHDVRLDHILPLMEAWEPLFGHKVATRTARGSSTYWVLLKRRMGMFQPTQLLLELLSIPR